MVELDCDLKIYIFEKHPFSGCTISLPLENVRKPGIFRGYRNRRLT